MEEDFETGELIEIMIATMATGYSICGIMVDQTIEFDFKTESFSSTIRSAAIMKKEYNSVGTVTGMSPLFWVKF